MAVTVETLTDEQLSTLIDSGGSIESYARGLLRSPRSPNAEAWRNNIAMHARRIAEIVVPDQAKP